LTIIYGIFVQKEEIIQQPEETFQVCRGGQRKREHEELFVIPSPKKRSSIEIRKNFRNSIRIWNQKLQFKLMSRVRGKEDIVWGTTLFSVHIEPFASVIIIGLYQLLKKSTSFQYEERL